MKISKPIATPFGLLTMTRSDVAEEFHCGRCDAPKKAKAKATRLRGNGSTDVICNGCYGNLLSRS